MLMSVYIFASILPLLLPKKIVSCYHVCSVTPDAWYKKNGAHQNAGMTVTETANTQVPHYCIVPVLFTSSRLDKFN